MDWEAAWHKLAGEFAAKQGEMHGQMERLRRENDALRRQLENHPAALTELQDRVTILEGRRH